MSKITGRRLSAQEMLRRFTRLELSQADDIARSVRRYLHGQPAETPPIACAARSPLQRCHHAISARRNPGHHHKVEGMEQALVACQRTRRDGIRRCVSRADWLRHPTHGTRQREARGREWLSGKRQRRPANQHA